MSSQQDDRPYVLVQPPVHQNRWNETLQRVEAGRVVTAKWRSNDAIIRVFVPDGSDLVATADTLIRDEGTQIDQLMGTG